MRNKLNKNVIAKYWDAFLKLLLIHDPLNNYKQLYIVVLELQYNFPIINKHFGRKL